MSMRSEIRKIAARGLSASPHLQGVAQISTWARVTDAETLPILGVVTAQETVQPQTLSHFMRGTLLQVVLKRLGADELEDQLDVDADAIEAAVCGAFAVAGLPCVPERVTFTLNGDGEQRVGTVLADFRVTWARTLQGNTL